MTKESRYNTRDVCTNCFYDSCESCRGGDCVCRKHHHHRGIPRAKMPWGGDIAHTKLSDGRKVLRGSREEAIDRYGENS